MGARGCQLADYREALGSLMSRLSEDEENSGSAAADQADWYWLDRSEVRFSSKSGPRPYLHLVGEGIGSATVYPRTTLKGETPQGDHYPDQRYPRGVMHRAHIHAGRGCRLSLDATVLACEPRPVAEYVLRHRRSGCQEGDRNWLRYFGGALDALIYEDSAGGGSSGD